MVSLCSLVCPGFYHGIKGVHHCVQPFYVLIMCVCEFLCQDSACVGQKVLDPPETGVNKQSWAPQYARNRTDKCTLNCSAIAPAPSPFDFLTTNSLLPPHFPWVDTDCLTLHWSSWKWKITCLILNLQECMHLMLWTFAVYRLCCVPQIFIWWTCLFFLN